MAKIVHPNCEECPLNRRRVGPSGPEDADVVIVGESPGMKELKLGRPFVGPSGELLWKEVPEDEKPRVFVTNAMQCKPPKYKGKASKNTQILQKAARCCRDRLLSEIQAHPRKLIIALGNAAMWSTSGNYALKITQDRGQLIPSELAELGIFPIIHPAALLHGSGSYKQFKEDISYSFDLASGRPPKKPIVPEIIEVTPENLTASVNELVSSEYAAGDIETGGFDRFNDPLLCLGVCSDPSKAFILPRELLHAEEHRGELKRLMDELLWIWHNGKFDISFLRREGFDISVDEDTMLLSYCLDEAPGMHDLEQIAKNLIGAPNYKHMIQSYLPNKAASYSLIPTDVLYHYCGLDISNTRQIWPILRKEVAASADLEKLYTQLLIPASEMLYHVEQRGLHVDKQRLIDLQDPEDPGSVYSLVESKKKTIQEIAGYKINPNSNPQIQKLFWDELGLKKVKGRSTDKSVLEKLPDHPVVVAMRVYRKVAKQYSTYIIGAEKALNEDTGCVHTSFLIHGTRTGRLSARKPPVQTIPRLPLIRGIYKARDGYIFIEPDLNQAELRCLAQLSKDPDLCAIYNDPNHPGLHHEVAVKLFSKDYTDEEKMRAKAVNFGIVYGREAPSLAQEFEIPRPEAQRWIDGWFERFPKAGEFIADCRKVPLTGGTMTTLFGRKKRHHLVTRENLRDLMNQASNFPHQSIASDINLMAAIRLESKLRHLGVFIVNLVHDSLLIECPDDLALIDKVVKMAAYEMESIPRERGLTRVPFLVEAKTGHRWGSLEAYNFNS